MNGHMIRALCTALLLALLSATASAQQRTLDVPATARWQHARSQVILPRAIGELPRSAIIENIAPELDVMTHYEDANTRITVFLFRPRWANVAMWFERAEAGMRSNTMFGTTTPLADGPTMFARPGGSVLSGMRRTYSATGEYQTTSIAVMPVGIWLVKVRISSKTLDPAAVDTLMTSALAGIAVPATLADGAPVAEIAACAEPMRWRRARIIRPTMGSVLMSSVIAMAVNSPESVEAEGAEDRGTVRQNLCREPGNHAAYTVYRDLDVANAYQMAVGDAGAAVTVGRMASALLGGDNVDVMMSLHNQSLIYPSFNRLPAPQQVYEMVTTTQPASSATSDPDIPPAAGEQPQTTITLPSN